MADSSSNHGVSRAGQARHPTQRRILKLRRLHALPSNQGLITTFAVICFLILVLIYLETSRILIPSKVLSKKELHTLTSGFKNDLPFEEKSSHNKGSSHLTSDQRPHRPQAIVVGFSHCGGSNIMTSLSTHPDVVVNRKDVKYFTGNQSEEWYVSHMPPSSKHQVTVDVSYSYITNKTALKRIKSFNNTIRIIVLVCDPISRLLENNADFLRRQGKEQPPLPVAPNSSKFDVDFLKSRVFTNVSGAKKMNVFWLSELGDYFRFMIDLFQVFSRKQVVVIENNRFNNDTDTELSKVFQLLGVKRHEKQDLAYHKVLNVFGNTKSNSTVSDPKTCKESGTTLVKLFRTNAPSLFEELRHFYKPFNKRLFLYLDEEYDWI